MRMDENSRIKNAMRIKENMPRTLSNGIYLGWPAITQANTPSQRMAPSTAATTIR
jgi:hypothetical protein